MFKKLLSVLMAVCILAGITPKAFAAWNTNYTLTGNKAQDIVNVAVAQKGKTGSELGYSVDWCSYFVYDCAQKAGVTEVQRQGYASSLFREMTKSGVEGDWFSDVTARHSGWTGGKGGGLSRGYDTQYRQGMNSAAWAPRIGDIVFFARKGYSTISHVAIVQSSSGNNFTVVHGNWSKKVTTDYSMTKGKYNGDFIVCAYVRPAYGDIPPNPPHPTLRSGSSGSEVSLLQNLLNSVHNAGLAVDGEYGPATVAAVKWFQEAHGLTVDGVCGPNTWQALEAAKAVGTTSKPSVSVSGQNVTVTWSYSGSGTSVDVHLIQHPWGWSDVKYKQTLSPGSTSCVFSGVAPGYYRVFTVARPNADSVQSEWAEFSVSEPHTTHTKGSFVRNGTEHPHYNYYTCTVCGQEFTDGSTTPDNYCKQCHWEHIWDAGKVTKEPTLTENGIRTYTCTICGSTKDEPISPATSIVIPFPDYMPHLQGMYTITSDGTLRVSKNSDYHQYEDLAGSDVYKQYRTSITKLIFEEGVDFICDGFIGSNQQYALDNVTSIELPSSLKELGMGAFRFCPSVESIYIPENVSEIAYRAFSYCKSLKRIEVSENNPWFKSVDGIVYTKDMSKLIAFPEGWSGDYSPPAHLKSVGRLINCSKVNSVVIPSGQTQIFSDDFAGCKSLRYITIPKSVKKINYSSFAGCSSLTDIYYEGTAEDWNKIEITKKGEYDTGEDATGIILNATKHFSSPSAPTPPPVTPDAAFSDVPSGQYYTEPVTWAVEKGITSGTGNNQFSPNTPCTRGQIVTFLWRAAGKPEPKTANNPFKDVKSSDYYYKAVQWAVENSITSGISTTAFGSEQPCTRAQAVTFMWRAAGKPGVSGGAFSDVETGSYYADAVRWAVKNGITSGTGKTTFSPGQNCTRGQIVTFLYRANN